jgi:ribosomal protein L29
MKKKASFVESNTTELKDLLAEARTAVHTAKMALAGVRAKNLKEARAAKKTVARIMTELSKRAKNLAE